MSETDLADRVARLEVWAWGGEQHTPARLRGIVAPENGDYQPSPGYDAAVTALNAHFDAVGVTTTMPTALAHETYWLVVQAMRKAQTPKQTP